MQYTVWYVLTTKYFMYELSHVSAEYDHCQVFNNSQKSTFTVRYMLNCTPIFDVLQYDVNQTLENEIKYTYNTYCDMLSLW
jgi:hypothetical protein